MNAEKLKNLFKNKNNRIKIIVCIGLIGIIFISLSDVLPSTKSNNNFQSSEYTYNWDEYKTFLEKDLTNVISSISGVGKCEIMITLDTTNEYVYAKNSKYRTDENSSDSEEEYSILDKDDGENPLLIKQYFPKVKGVAVVCEGGDNIQVRSNIISSVQALFDISTTKISVTKIYSKNR